MYSLFLLFADVEQNVKVSIPDSFKGLLMFMGFLLGVVLIFPIVFNRLFAKKRRR